MDEMRRMSALFNLMKDADGFPGPTVPCPDCAAVAESDDKGGKTLCHEETCPLYGGVEKACDGDRDFFNSHPNADEYYRPITRAEIIDFEYTTGNRIPEWVNKVHVVQVAPGIRLRQPVGVRDGWRATYC